MKKDVNIFKTKLMGSPTVVVNGATANKFMSNEFILVGLGRRPCLVFSNRCWKVCLSLPVDVHGTKFSRAKKARAEIEKALVGEIRRKKEAMESGGQEGDGMLFSKLAPAYIRGVITEEGVVNNVGFLVFSAHDTKSCASCAITMTFLLLAPTKRT
ncbi:putative cytochrome P450 superfamily [Helianthus anomalus]